MAASATLGVPEWGPLVGIKLRAPVLVAGYCARGRLSDRLDEALADHVRLTVVSAPPGYGKTVAVVGWLSARRAPYVWLTLHADENDLARFMRYLVAALRAARPGVAAALEVFGPGAAPTPDLVTAILLDGIGADDAPLVVVLDDYHLIGSRPVTDLVRGLVENAPPFLHLVLVTREDPALPLARLRAHGRLVEVRADDLRFTGKEASAYLAGAGVGVEPPLVQRVVERTEGWAAGLQLAALSLAGRPDVAPVVDDLAGSRRFVFDYLADEVLGGLEEDLRAFLVRISIAERFTAELCRDLTGRGDAEALLDRADRANLFLVRLDAEGCWYRFHHVFGDYLRTHLDDGERRELNERASSFFERRGFAADAIGHAVAAGSIDRAVRVVEGAARAALESGELATLLGWLQALPADRVAASPELVWVKAWALFLTGQVADALSHAERHLAATRERGPAEGRLLVLLALMATVTGPDAQDLAAEGLELVGEDPLFRSLALQAVGLSILARGEYPAAVQTLRAALEAALQAGHPTAVLPAVNPLGQALVAAGRRDEAEAVCRRAITDCADPRGRPLPIAWPARMVLGMARYEAGDPAEARRELEAGLEAAHALGIGRPVLGWATPYLALTREACGDPNGALEALQTSQSEVHRAGMALPGQAAQTLARIQLSRGDVAGAARWADAASPEAPPGSPLLDLLEREMDVSVARVRLAQGRLGQARVLLTRPRETQEASGAVAELITIGVLQASLEEATGHRVEAVRALQAAVRLAAPGGYLQRFVDDGDRVAHLLPSVRATAPEFVDDLIRACARRRETAPSIGSAGGTALWQDEDGRLLEELTPRELDVLRLMAQGANNADIAAGLTISLGTAKWHVGHVLAKLGATSRTQALVRAQRRGLV